MSDRTYPAAVKRAGVLRKNGLTCTQIANGLQAEGYETKSGKPNMGFKGQSWDVGKVYVALGYTT